MKNEKKMILVNEEDHQLLKKMALKEKCPMYAMFSKLLANYTVNVLDVNCIERQRSEIYSLLNEIIARLPHIEKTATNINANGPGDLEDSEGLDGDDDCEDF